MAYSDQGLKQVGYNGNDGNTFTYVTTDNLNDIEVADYFPALATRLKANSKLMVIAADGNADYLITAISPSVTIQLWEGGATGATLVFAGNVLDGGGSTFRALVVTGAQIGDVISCVKTTDTNASYIETAEANLDSVNVTLNVDPGPAQYDVLVFRN